MRAKPVICDHCGKHAVVPGEAICRSCASTELGALVGGDAYLVSKQLRRDHTGHHARARDDSGRGDPTSSKKSAC